MLRILSSLMLSKLLIASEDYCSDEYEDGWPSQGSDDDELAEYEKKEKEEEDQKLEYALNHPEEYSLLDFIDYNSKKDARFPHKRVVEGIANKVKKQFDEDKINPFLFELAAQLFYTEDESATIELIYGEKKLSSVFRFYLDKFPTSATKDLTNTQKERKFAYKMELLRGEIYQSFQNYNKRREFATHVFGSDTKKFFETHQSSFRKHVNKFHASLSMNAFARSEFIQERFEELTDWEKKKEFLVNFLPQLDLSRDTERGLLSNLEEESFDLDVILTAVRNVYSYSRACQKYYHSVEETQQPMAAKVLFASFWKLPFRNYVDGKVEDDPTRDAYLTMIAKPHFPKLFTEEILGEDMLASSVNDSMAIMETKSARSSTSCETNSDTSSTGTKASSTESDRNKRVNMQEEFSTLYKLGADVTSENNNCLLNSLRRLGLKFHDEVTSDTLETKNEKIRIVIHREFEGNAEEYQGKFEDTEWEYDIVQGKLKDSTMLDSKSIQVLAEMYKIHIVIYVYDDTLPQDERLKEHMSFGNEYMGNQTFRLLSCNYFHPLSSKYDRNHYRPLELKNNIPNPTEHIENGSRWFYVDNSNQLVSEKFHGQAEEAYQLYSGNQKVQEFAFEKTYFKVDFVHGRVTKFEEEQEHSTHHDLILKKEEIQEEENAKQSCLHCEACDQYTIGTNILVCKYCETEFESIKRKRNVTVEKEYREPLESEYKTNRLFEDNVIRSLEYN